MENYPVNRDEIKQAISGLELGNKAVIACDTDGTIRYWNEACEDFFGYSKEEVEGYQTLALVLPSSSIDNHLTRYIPQVATGNIPSKAMAAGRLVSGTTRDGKTVSFRIGLSNLEIKEEQLAVATLIKAKEETKFIPTLPDPKTIAKWSGILGSALTVLFTSIQVALKNIAPNEVPVEPEEEELVDS